MFSLTSTVASAKLTSKVRPHPFAPAPRTRFRSRDLERERFPTQKARYNEWIFSFLFFWRLGRFFSAPTKRWITHAENPPTTTTTTTTTRTRGGVFFYPVATKTRTQSRAKVLARLDATEHARAETSRFRRRPFFSRAREEGGGCVDFEFSSRKGWEEAWSRIFFCRSLSMSNPTKNAR